MPLHALSDDERRSHCRRDIEALELWLRRLVHETFLKAYGPGYLGSTGDDGNRLFRKKTVEMIEARCGEDPTRYPRPIDATALDDLVHVICKFQTYDRHFRDALRAAFPEGSQEARTFLNRIVEIRNNLSHANPITVHEAARAICYTRDVIASVKEYYAAMNTQREYNVPTILKITDSLGNVRQGTELRRDSGSLALCDFHRTASGRLYPGDRLAIQVEVDPTFERLSYRLQWTCKGNRPPEFGDTEHVVIEIDNSHVREKFHVDCQIISSRAWQRFGHYDDWVRLIYKVLPPPA